MCRFTNCFSVSMDPYVITFTEPLGPGQIVDRQSIVDLPTGFIKIAIFSKHDEFCFGLVEYQEVFGKKSHLGLKVTVKAFLSFENHVIEGQEEVTGYRGLHGPVTKFDRSAIEKDLKLNKNQTSSDSTEILQICVYVSRSNTKNKVFLGTVHVSLHDIDPNKSKKLNTEVWYKIFRTSSFITGCPIGDVIPHCINRPSSNSKTLGPPTSSSTNNQPFTSSSSESITESHMYDVTCKNNLEDGSQRFLSKRNSFRRLSRIILNLMQRTTNKATNEDATDTPKENNSSSNSLTVDYARRSAHSSKQNSDGMDRIGENRLHVEPGASSGGSEKDLFNSRNPFQRLSLKSRNRTTKRSRCNRSLSVSAGIRILTKDFNTPGVGFRRSEEVICKPSKEFSPSDHLVDSACWENVFFKDNDGQSCSGNSFMYKNLHGVNIGYSQNSLSHKMTCNHQTDSTSFHNSKHLKTEEKLKKLNSPDSGTDEKLTNKLKHIPSFLTLTRTVQEKLKSKSKSRSRSLAWNSEEHSTLHQLDDETDLDVQRDNVYAVLKSLKRIASPPPTSSNSFSNSNDKFKFTKSASCGSSGIEDLHDIGSSICASPPEQHGYAPSGPNQDVSSGSSKRKHKSEKKTFLKSPRLLRNTLSSSVSSLVQVKSQNFNNFLNTCQEKRKKFAKQRAIAMEFDTKSASDTSSFYQSDNWLQKRKFDNLRVDSDDDYVTCSEKLSCTDVSTTSSYTTLSDH